MTLYASNNLLISLAGIEGKQIGNMYNVHIYNINYIKLKEEVVSKWEIES